MKYVLIALLLVGCTEKTVDDGRDTRRGEARLAVFSQCMELAAKNGRKGDDDVSDIVIECTQSSYFMTNYIQ